jgi:hypothetical protein
MSRAMFEEVDQISTEMKAIINRSEQEQRKPNRGEQAALEQLTSVRDVLLGDTIFHGYV